MKRFLIPIAVALAATVVVSIPLEDEGLNVKMTDETPRFDVTTDNLRSGIPEITVHFANGINERMVLDHYGHNDAEKCNYIGYLAESKGNVAVTGCLKKSGDKMDITLLSKYSQNRMFSLDFDGTVNKIANPFSIGATSRVVRVGDRITDDEEDEAIADQAAEVAVSAIENTEDTATYFQRENIASMPATIKFGYETSMKNKLAALNTDFKTFVDSVMAHVQTYYKDASLTTQVIFDYDASASGALYEEATWTAQDHLDDASAVTKRVETDAYDLYAWYVADVDEDGNSKDGTSGIAWLGTACQSGQKTSINEWWGRDGTTDTAGSAYILAHELGHNFGMDHDFGEKHGGTDDYTTSTNYCNGKGIMSYGDGVPTVWSTCSVSDFAGYYQLRDWGCTCLKDDSDTTLEAACCTDCGDGDCDPNAKAVNSWLEWGECIAECGSGYRTRMCDSEGVSQSQTCTLFTSCEDACPGECCTITPDTICDDANNYMCNDGPFAELFQTGCRKSCEVCS